MGLAHSELILNADGSIYHLNLLPQDIATTIILVGDPDRVPKVSQYFDAIEVKKGKREFLTHTGTVNGSRISVLSTGIGTDNIDIVFNEIDALVNIDFSTRTVKPTHTTLNIVRIGTSGAIPKDIPVNSFLLSEYTIGFDGLLHYYSNKNIQYPAITKAFVAQTNWSPNKPLPYVVKYDETLGKKLLSDSIILGFTGTNSGFYGPQGRVLRLALENPDFNATLASFTYEQMVITNLEMESAGIYALAKLLGHRAASMHCILANRSTGEFSDTPDEAIDKLIQYTLNKLTEH